MFFGSFCSGSCACPGSGVCPVRTEEEENKGEGRQTTQERLEEKRKKREERREERREDKIDKREGAAADPAAAMANQNSELNTRVGGFREAYTIYKFVTYIYKYYYKRFTRFYK